MTRPAPLPLLLLLILTACLAATGARAQDPLARARAEYAGLTGDWARPGQGCAPGGETWSFGMETVRAGGTSFDLLGIGAGPGEIRLDLAGRLTGERRALALAPVGGILQVRGGGVWLTLLPCPEAAPEPLRRRDEVITSRPLDGLPAEDDLRERLGGAPPAPAPADGLSPEEIYDTRLTGAWRGADGSCGWRLGRDRIMAGGAAYDVVNFSGTAERIGIQALRDDGAPATFTLTPQGAATAAVSWSVAGESQAGATLARC